jgi:hypothetical protein
MEIKLATVRAAYSDRNNGRLCTERAINSDDFTTDQVRIFKRNKEFEQIFNPDGFCFLKSPVVGYDGA